ncbi:MAG: DUF2058 domain-containing protein [Methylococcales bacterium]|nr:DUF2058 domain-containing protein [Methylococcales bacterium]
MAISLQEQLLKAGLSTQTKAKTLKTNKRKQVKVQRKNKVMVNNDTKASLEKAQRQQAEKDRQLNQEKQQQAEKKAITAQIKQLIDLNKVTQDKDGEAYNFSDHNHVKKIYVHQDVRTQISEGRLAIVKIQQRYEIVPAEIALKIRQRDASYVLLLNDCKEKVEETDLYANYQIPDDLMW